MSAPQTVLQQLADGFSYSAFQIRHPRTVRLLLNSSPAGYLESTSLTISQTLLVDIGNSKSRSSSESQFITQRMMVTFVA